MPRSRTLITKGVYKDKFGVAIVVSIQGKPREFRADADGTRYNATKGAAWFRDERTRVLARERLKVDRRADADTLFPADVVRFLATISSQGHRLNTQGYMAHWEQHFADRPRNTITDVDAQTAYAAIGKADSTRIHIRRALIQFYEALNGKSGYNPGRSLKKPSKSEEEVRDLPWDVIERMFKALPSSRSKARLMLIAYIGLPQKQIAALQPSDLRLKARELVVHPRRKGAGVAGQVQPLSDVAIAALEEFVRVNAFGTFQNRQLVETFRSAAKKAKVALPADARPYDLRHSFLTELARGGADIRDIATLGMHATLEQAARYIKGAGSARATNTIASIPRFSTTTRRRNSPKYSSSVQSIRRAKGPRRPNAPGKKR